MDQSVYQNFGLRSGPFELTPDPRVYYAAPSHEEALATLNYAFQAGKACSLVLGASGAGKTLLARQLLTLAGQQEPVAWVQGVSTADRPPTVRLMRFGRRHPLAGKEDESITLADLYKSMAARGPTPTIVVDNADALDEAAWQTLLAISVGTGPEGQAPRMFILGTPNLMQTIANPALVRLRRRIFRTCVLEPLTDQQVCEYVRHRVTAFGGAPDLFSPNALALLTRLATGNPGLVNQLCENALIEAFARGRDKVTAVEMLGSVRALVGKPQLGLAADPWTVQSDSLRRRLQKLEARLSKALVHVRPDKPQAEVAAEPAVADAQDRLEALTERFRRAAPGSSAPASHPPRPRLIGSSTVRETVGA